MKSDEQKSNSVPAGAVRRGYDRAPRGASIAERLDYHSIPEPNSGCRLWLGTLRSNGYPQINVDGVNVPAHRVAWSEKNGPIPPGMFICHKCDVRICIEEPHLFLGTHAENMADMRAKDRGPRGERSAKALLTANQVRAILADTRTHPVIGADYGVAATTISDIKRGARWKHITGERQ